MDDKENGLLQGEGASVQKPQNGEFASSEQEKKGSQIPGPIVGIDEEGYFFVKIHMSYSYLAMIGFLEEAREWLMLRHKGSARNKFKDEEKIIKPKGFRGFNIFK
jgi:hypothetical protein